MQRLNPGSTTVLQPLPASFAPNQGTQSATSSKPLHDSSGGTRTAAQSRAQNHALKHATYPGAAAKGLEKPNLDLSISQHNIHADDGMRRPRRNATTEPFPAMQLRFEKGRERTDSTRGPDRAAAAAAMSRLREPAVNAAKAQLAKEIATLDLTSDSSPNIFLRGNSDGAKLAGTALKGTFKMAMPSIVASMNEAFEKATANFGLNPSDGELDQAVIATYQALLQSLGSVSFPPELENLAKHMANQIDQRATAQKTRLPSDKQQAVSTNAAACKDKVVKALLLRSFCTELTIALSNDEGKRFKTLMAGRSKTGYALAMVHFSSALTGQINEAASGTKKTALSDSFPGYGAYLATQTNQLQTFAAMQKLKAEL